MSVDEAMRIIKTFFEKFTNNIVDYRKKVDRLEVDVELLKQYCANLERLKSK